MKKNIGIFFGGRSVEHEVSIISALQIIKVIDRTKFDVTPVYITRDGIWYTGNWLLYIDNFKNIGQLIKRCKKVIPSLNANDGVILQYPGGIFKSAKTAAKIDVAFPVFHGTSGEDGSVQGVFEIMNIPYVGSDVVSSAICMSKSLTKEICRAIQIPVIEHYALDADSWYKNKESHVTSITKMLDFPVIVKPNDLGSSIGISKATDIRELENAIEVASTYSNNILIENFITAIKEVNCSVAETPNGTEVSECEEPIVMNSELLSFDEKYLASGASSEGMAGTKRKIPASISVAQKKEIQDYAIRIFEHLGCSGVIRVDFIIDESVQRIYLNEINTIPGSLAFYLWEPAGKKFTTLVTEIIETAVKRFSKKNKVKKNYTSNILFNIDGSKLSGKLG